MRTVLRFTGLLGQAFFLMTLVLATLPVSAQNLLLNPGFNTSLASWVDVGSGVPADGSRAHAAFPDDVGAQPASGSVRLSLASLTAAATQIGIGQCLVAVPSQNYNYGARAKFPNGQNSGDVRAFVEVEFFGNASCATSTLRGEGEFALIGTAYPLDNAVWRGVPGTVPGSAASVVSPPTAASVQVRLLVERNGGTSAAQALFDNAFFGFNLTPVLLQSFSVE